jgi:hypothetical protein
VNFVIKIYYLKETLDTTLCDQVWQCLAAGWYFSPGTPVSSTNKTDRHDITEIVLQMELNTTNHHPLIHF